MNRLRKILDLNSKFHFEKDFSFGFIHIFLLFVRFLFIRLFTHFVVVRSYHVHLSAFIRSSGFFAHPSIVYPFIYFLHIICFLSVCLFFISSVCFLFTGLFFIHSFVFLKSVFGQFVRFYPFICFLSVYPFCCSNVHLFFVNLSSFVLFGPLPFFCLFVRSFVYPPIHAFIHSLISITNCKGEENCKV